MEYINLDYDSGQNKVPRLLSGTENYYRFVFSCPKCWVGKRIACFKTVSGDAEYEPIINGQCDLPIRFNKEPVLRVTVFVIDGISKMESKPITIRQGG